MLRLSQRTRSLLKFIAIAGLVISDVVLALSAIRVSNAPVAVLPTIGVVPSVTASKTDTPPPLISLTPTTQITLTSLPTESPTVTEPASPTPTLESTEADTPTDEPVIEGAAGLPVQIKIKDRSGTQARSGPGISYDVVSKIAFNSAYTVQAFGKDFFGYTWYLVDLSDGSPAWILAPAAAIVAGSGPMTQVAMAQTIPPTPSLAPTLTLTPGRGLESQLQAVPVLSGIGPTLRTIYLKGQQLGNHPNVFAKVGDCNTKSDAFLMPIDHGLYRLGRYASLQKTISTFKGSFGRDSIAAQVGFNVASAQDNFWADPKVCKADESPVDCEYRVTHPAVAIIMFGANDALFFTPAAFRKYMGQIVEKSINDGIIPVLMTFTWHDYGTLYPT